MRLGRHFGFLAETVSLGVVFSHLFLFKIQLKDSIFFILYLFCPPKVNCTLFLPYNLWVLVFVGYCNFVGLDKWYSIKLPYFYICNSIICGVSFGLVFNKMLAFYLMYFFTFWSNIVFFACFLYIVYFLYICISLVVSLILDLTHIF